MFTLLIVFIAGCWKVLSRKSNLFGQLGQHSGKKKAKSKLHNQYE